MYTDGIFQKLYHDTRDGANYELRWHDDIARMNYSYHQELTYLRQKRKLLRAREEDIRKIEDAQFPRNMADWHTKSKDVRLRVARFLDGDSTRQEKMMNEFGWAWRQTAPLKAEYSRSVSRDPFFTDYERTILA
jgi:hypothetical protein